MSSTRNLKRVGASCHCFSDRIATEQLWLSVITFTPPSIFRVCCCCLSVPCFPLLPCDLLPLTRSRTDNLVLSSNSGIFIRYAEDALAMLEHRIALHGTGYTHYWYISAACALLKAKLASSETTLQKQQAIDRVSKQYYRVLGGQEDFAQAKKDLLIGLDRVSITTVNETERPLCLSWGLSESPVKFYLDEYSGRSDAVPQSAAS